MLGRRAARKRRGEEERKMKERKMESVFYLLSSIFLSFVSRLPFSFFPFSLYIPLNYSGSRFFSMFSSGPTLRRL